MLLLDLGWCCFFSLYGSILPFHLDFIQRIIQVSLVPFILFLPVSSFGCHQHPLQPTNLLSSVVVFRPECPLKASVFIDELRPLLVPTYLQLYVFPYLLLKGGQLPVGPHSWFEGLSKLCHFSGNFSWPAWLWLALFGSLIITLSLKDRNIQSFV